ncbi:MAG: M48 family metalloprotease [Candidatus Krumholzibacteriota bacterium]
MWEQIAANKRKSMVLVFVVALLLMALGWFGGEYFMGRGGGPAGLVVALIVWLVMTLTAWFQGDNVMLSISGARKVDKKDLPILHNVVEEMTLAAGLPKIPDVYVIDDPAPNAFATGRRPETASVAVTSGLLKRLSRDELQGVIAHEIAHVRNRDIQLMLFAGVLAGAIVILAEIGLRGMWFGGGRSRSRRDSGSDGSGIIAIVAIVLMILAPILAQLIYFAVSRKREYLADASAASFTRYPEGLASALDKISRAPDKLGRANSAMAPMYIINPLKRTKKMAANATSTHPPIDERIRILRSMGSGSFADYDRSYMEVKGAKKGVIPGSALKEDSTEPAPTRERVSASQRENARQVDDFFYRQDGYHRIECPCGTVLKIPPDFEGNEAKCPRCGTRHKV